MTARTTYPVVRSFRRRSRTRPKVLAYRLRRARAVRGAFGSRLRPQARLTRFRRKRHRGLVRLAIEPERLFEVALLDLVVARHELRGRLIGRLAGGDDVIDRLVHDRPHD